ncbi:MAG: hypothetical protein HY456_00385 [Parcubacteria group bacterium]|nr:hypothetical protein [Parcubacteria group bacterium]
MTMNREKEAERQSHEEQNEIEHTVGIMGTTFTVKLAVGAKLSDLIRRVQEEAAEQKIEDFNIHEYLIRLNDRDIEMVNGALKEDPVLDQASALSLVVKKLSGGA